MSAELAPGAVVAGFRIESLVGHGAMAEVYRARDVQNDRVVALKLLDVCSRTTSASGSGSCASRSSRRASTTRTSSGRSPSGEDDGRLYLAMELIDGSDLRAAAPATTAGSNRNGRSTSSSRSPLRSTPHTRAGPRPSRRQARQHPRRRRRDGEHAYVCDFGLARHVSSVSSLTGDRGFVGTIDYVPPEQIEGGTVDARADVYSLGCVLYECLAGVRPFDRDSELSVVFAHLNEPPPQLTDVRPELPAAFDDVFATALAKAPDDRYSSCGELADAAARSAPRRGARAAANRAAASSSHSAPRSSSPQPQTGVFLLTRSGPATRPTTITQTSLAGAKLGDSNVALERRLGRRPEADRSVPGRLLASQAEPTGPERVLRRHDRQAVELVTLEQGRPHRRR